MNDIHFKSLDLNLLRVFEALFAERSATRAGARLGLSQSAISHALNRLRRALHDDLFIRGVDGLIPTARAAVLGPQIVDALEKLEQVLGAPIFDPGDSDRQFVIGGTAYFCAVLLPAVMQRFMKAAPHARLRVRAENLRAEELDRGRLDIILGAFVEVPSRFQFTPLFHETGVWVVRETHPALAAGPNVAALAGLPRVAIAIDDGPGLGLHGRSDAGLKRPQAWQYDKALEGMEGGTESVLTVPDTYSALAMVRQTDMVSILPRRIAEPAAQRGGLVIIDPPVKPAPLEFGAVTRGGEQGGVVWLLSILKDAAFGLDTTP